MSDIKMCDLSWGTLYVIFMCVLGISQGNGGTGKWIEYCCPNEWPVVGTSFFIWRGSKTSWASTDIGPEQLGCIVCKDKQESSKVINTGR